MTPWPVASSITLPGGITTRQDWVMTVWGTVTSIVGRLASAPCVIEVPITATVTGSWRRALASACWSRAKSPVPTSERANRLPSSAAAIEAVWAWRSVVRGDPIARKSITSRRKRYIGAVTDIMRSPVKQGSSNAANGNPNSWNFFHVSPFGPLATNPSRVASRWLTRSHIL